MDDRERYADRWRSAFRDWDKRLSLVWGMLDPLAVPAVLEGLRELRPDAEVTELPDVSHNPQIEVPEQVAAAIRAAVDRGRVGT
jgi:pimeloyl-ACP methyl ester carboxylesterase